MRAGMLKSTLDSVSREVPPDLLLKWNEILSRLTNVLQIAKDARHHWIDPVVSEAIDSLPNRINSQGFDPWGFSPQEAKFYYSLARHIYDYFRPEIFGIENMPKGRVLIVPNHSGQLPFDGLVPLYVISAMFGLFQGGIVPAYAIIIREYFAPQEAGARVGAVIMATLIGMALGGWMSGWIFDLTGSYRAAFLNGMAWNLLNLSIVGWLFWRMRQQRAVTARPQHSPG